MSLLPVHAAVASRANRTQMEEILFGGASRDRTDDLIVANDALSQLSYSPTAGRILKAAAGRPRLFQCVIKREWQSNGACARCPPYRCKERSDEGGASAC